MTASRPVHQQITQAVRLALGGETYSGGNDSRDSATGLVKVVQMQYPVTPDGRYFVVRGRLWRCTNPALSEDERSRLTSELMRHRAAVGRARRAENADAEQAARRKVNEAKIALGERGPVWWTDGAPDYNRYLVKNTPYRRWYERLQQQQDDEGR